MPEFLVVSEDDAATDVAPVIVSAESSDEAIDKYLRKVYAKDETFRDSVFDRSINMTFAERFFLVTKEEHRHFDRGTYKVDLKAVQERVRSYFKDDPSVGEKYFEYLRSGDVAVLDEEVFETIAASDTSGVAVLEMALLEHI